MKSVFAHIGDILHYDFFPSYLEKNTFECIVKFRDGSEAETAIHLDGTEFGDRCFKVVLMGPLAAAAAAVVTTTTTTAEESRSKQATPSESRASSPKTIVSHEDGSSGSEERLRRLQSDFDFLRRLNPDYCIIVRHVDRDHAVKAERSALEKDLHVDVRSCRLLESDNLVVEMERSRDVDRILKHDKVSLGQMSYSVEDGRYRIPRLLERLDRKLDHKAEDKSHKRRRSRSKSPDRRHRYRR